MINHLFQSRYFEIIASFVVIIFILIIRYFFRSLIKKHAHKYDLDIGQRKYAFKFFNFVLAIVLFGILGIIWDVSVKGLSVYFASIFTIIGVALFATWSILSNITCSVILFFNSPFKIGSKIKIMDKDDSVEGTVMDITFFTIQIKTKEGDIVSYPNNIAIQKPIIKIK
jgi:small-conductance mechanosensitive channel